MIRSAKCADIPRLIELLRESRARSIYASKVTPDYAMAEHDLRLYMNRHLIERPGGTFFAVSENRGTVEGLLAAVIESVCFSLTAVSARIFMLYQSHRADPQDALRLLSAFHEWAEKLPGIVQARADYADYVPVDEDRVGRLFERAGFQKSGVSFRKEF